MTGGKRDKQRKHILCLLVKHYIHLEKCKNDNKPTEMAMELYIRNQVGDRKFKKEGNTRRRHGGDGPKKTCLTLS
jgi:hypothetical protein